MTGMLWLIMLLSALQPPAASSQHASESLPDWTHKVDPDLRTLQQSYERMREERRAIDTDHPAIAPHGVHLDEKGDAMVDVLIQGKPAMLRSDGQVHLRASSGQHHAAEIPVAYLQELARESHVQVIESSRQLQTHNNRARSQANVEQVWDGENLFTGYTGEQTLVGIIDTGIDYLNPDFTDGDRTRIRYLMEFDELGNQQEWSRQDIEDNPDDITMLDRIGHGTHVSGTAAGNGQMDPRFSGMAPGAELIAVKATRDPEGRSGTFRSSDIMASAEYVADKAEELDMPVVINLSLGSVGGPADGTSTMDQMLSSLVEEAEVDPDHPSVMIVASAGNAGFDPIHAGRELGATDDYAVLWSADDPDQTSSSLWYDHQGINEVAVAAFQRDAAGNLEKLDRTEWLETGERFITDQPLFDNTERVGYVHIDAATTQSPLNGDGHISFRVHDNNENIDISRIEWGLLIRSSNEGGRMDSWADQGRYARSAEDLQAFGYNPVGGDNRMTTASPSTAENVISVGAYWTRGSWTNIDGNEFSFPEPPDQTTPTLGSLTFFSSKGPTRDGRMAPHVSAAGGMVGSVHSSHSEENDVDRAFIMENGNYRVNLGTSMSAPVVSGITSLMLQAHDQLTFEELESILAETSRQDGYTGDEPGNRFGYGKIDGSQATIAAETKSIEPAEVAGDFGLTPNYPNPFSSNSRIFFELDREAEVHIDVFSVSGRRVTTLLDGEQRSDGRHFVNINAGSLASGVYVVRLRAAGHLDSRKITVIH